MLRCIRAGAFLNAISSSVSSRFEGEITNSYVTESPQLRKLAGGVECVSVIFVYLFQVGWTVIEDERVIVRAAGIRTVFATVEEADVISRRSGLFS